MMMSLLFISTKAEQWVIIIQEPTDTQVTVITNDTITECFASSLEGRLE